MLIVSHDVIHFTEGVVVEIYLWFLVDKLFSLDLLLKKKLAVNDNSLPTNYYK